MATTRQRKSKANETTEKPSAASQPELPPQHQVVIVNRLSTKMVASVFAEDGTTPTSVNLAPNGRSLPVSLDRITPHTDGLVVKGYVRLEHV